jgi:hypothetical protein
MKVQNLSVEELASRLLAVEPKITKKDKYEACLQFKEEPFTPLDIRTVTDLLSGNPDKIKNTELAHDLLEFLETRAREYEELEERRRSGNAA